MLTTTLQKALKKNKHTKEVFGGVFPRDCLPIQVSKKKNVAFVVNTDPSDEIGEHWVVFFFTPQQAFYFDPYGIKPRHKEFLHFLKKRKTYSYWHKRVQGTGNTCGYFCLYFILSIQGQVNWKIFGDNFTFNDQYVRRLVQTHFQLK